MPDQANNPDAPPNAMRGRPRGSKSLPRSVECVICKKSFETNHSQGKYCSPECRQIGHRKSWNKYADANREDRRASSRRIYHKNPEARGLAISEYRKTEKGKAVVSKAGKKSRLKNSEKAKARDAVNGEIRAGRLKRQPCEVCGQDKAQAHHPDYSKPLLIKWLCPKHHREEHRRMENEKFKN